MNPLESLYAGKAGRLTIPNYAPPDVFPNGGWNLVAHCPKTPADGDGQDVRVFEARYPATFYRIDALPTPNSMGEVKPGYSLTTGSGMHNLVDMLVDAITSGMIGLRTEEPNA